MWIDFVMRAIVMHDCFVNIVRWFDFMFELPYFFNVFSQIWVILHSLERTLKVHIVDEVES